MFKLSFNIYDKIQKKNTSTIFELFIDLSIFFINLNKKKTYIHLVKILENLKNLT